METGQADTQSPRLTRLTIESLGSRGEGVAAHEGRRVFLPYALPGETVTADIEGARGRLVGIVAPSPERVAPVCRYFSVCGGCAVQAWSPPAYAAWKRGLVVDALARAGVAAEVAPLVDAHGAGRRRATFHARTDADGRPRVGYMRARSHEIAEIDVCPILAPGLSGALAAARAIAEVLRGKPLDIVATETESGLDVDLRGHGPLDDGSRARLVEVALAHDLARLSNHGVIVVESRKPSIALGAARMDMPPGAFLQATAAGEQAIADRVVAALDGARRVADLFAGVGTFALRLAARADVTAYDDDGAGLAALERAARSGAGLRPVAVEKRDLFRRPLTSASLDRLDALVMDPPRAGAQAQAREIAGSWLRRVVSVACDVESFARDAAILIEGGFSMGPVVPIDQFRYAPHVELVAAFDRGPVRSKRRLLG